MGIANAAQKTLEIVHTGLAAAAGSVSKPVVNVYTINRAATTFGINKTNVNTIFKASILDLVVAALNLSYASQIVQIRCLDDSEDPYATFVNTDPGAITGDRMPLHNCVSVHLGTATRGAYARGKKFYGPISESDTTTTSDVLNAGAITRFAAIGAALVAGFTDADGNVWKLCVVSRFHSVLDNPTNLYVYPVTRYLLNKRVSTLKRRKSRGVIV